MRWNYLLKNHTLKKHAHKILLCWRNVEQTISPAAICCGDFRARASQSDIQQCSSQWWWISVLVDFLSCCKSNCRSEWTWTFRLVRYITVSVSKSGGKMLLIDVICRFDCHLILIVNPFVEIMIYFFIYISDPWTVNFD